MPFFVQPPPPIDIPKTTLEFIQSQSAAELLDVAPVLRNLKLDESIENFYLKDKISSLASAWKSKTFLYSSISKIIEDGNFKKIVEIGEKAIPFIIEEIDKNPSNLVWALNFITKTSLNSNNYRQTVSDACKSWVKLWRQQYSLQQNS